MTVLEELEKKIVDAEGGIQHVLERLSELAELEVALDEANKTLIGAGRGLVTLAEVIGGVGSDLKRALVTLGEAAHSIRETDPALLLDAVGRIESRLEDVVGILPKVLSAIDNSTVSATRDFAAIQAEIKASREAANAHHQEAVVANASRIGTVRTIAIAALIVGLAILGLDLYARFWR